MHGAALRAATRTASARAAATSARCCRCYSAEPIGASDVEPTSRSRAESAGPAFAMPSEEDVASIFAMPSEEDVASMPTL